MTNDQRAKWLLEGKSCQNCLLQTVCEKNKEELLVCGDWEELKPDSAFRIIRNKFPSLISDKIFSVQPMERPSDNIYDITTVYTDKGEKNGEKEKE